MNKCKRCNIKIICNIQKEFKTKCPCLTCIVQIMCKSICDMRSDYFQNTFKQSIFLKEITIANKKQKKSI